MDQFIFIFSHRLHPIPIGRTTCVRPILVQLTTLAFSCDGFLFSLKGCTVQQSVFVLVRMVHCIGLGFHESHVRALVMRLFFFLHWVGLHKSIASDLLTDIPHAFLMHSGRIILSGSLLLDSGIIIAQAILLK